MSSKNTSQSQSKPKDMAQSITDVYAAAITPNSGVSVLDFADRCAQACQTGQTDESIEIDTLILPQITMREIQGAERVHHLQLQVICRFAHAAISKCDRLTKNLKNEIHSLLCSLAMKMDALAMTESDDITEHSAFSRFVIDTLAHHFSNALPKSFKWLYKTMEIAPNDVEPKVSKPAVLLRTHSIEKENGASNNTECSISKVLRTSASRDFNLRPTNLFQEVVLSSSQPNTPLIPIKVSKSVKIIEAPTPEQASVPKLPVRQTMVLKTPERPKRPPMKKRLVCVASSPPLRKPSKRLGVLSVFK